jgi:DNA-binding beta-propeller fold protein YncE
MNAPIRGGDAGSVILPSSWVEYRGGRHRPCAKEAAMRSTIALLVLAAASVAFAQTRTPYRILHTYTLGGDGGWDYVVPDPPNHRLFIARQDRIMVVDENTGAPLGEVTGIHGAHGVAVVPEGRGFATSGNDATIVMFDLASYAVLGRIHAAADADAIIYDPASRRVFSFNGDAHSATVVDAATGTRVTDVPLGGKPESGVSMGDGRVFVNVTDTNEVVEIDARAATVAARWPTAPCRAPVAMGVDTAHARIFSGCRSGVMAVSDVSAHKVVATVPIGMGVDGAAYDPSSGDVFASAGDGTLTVIHEDAPDRYRVVQTLTTAVGARTLGLDGIRHRLFLVAARFSQPAAGGRGRGPMVPGSFSLLEVGR